jgi:cell division transport system permease protein
VNAWLRHHLHSAAQSSARLAAAPLASLLSVLVIGITLALPLGGYALLSNLQGLLPALTYRAEVSVFLAAGTERAEAEDVARGLRAHEGVQEVRFVSRESALAGLKKSAGLAEVIGALPENPLPDAFVVVLTGHDGDLAERVAARARTLKNVAYAQADSAWIQRLNAFLGVGRTAVVLLAMVLGLALVAVIFNTIRLQILTQRDEIEVSRLVGATDAYIRRPFLYFGSLQGALGGLAALGIVAGGLAALNRDVSTLSGLYGTAFQLQLPEWRHCAALVLASALLGWLGAAASVSKHLREMEPQ